MKKWVMNETQDGRCFVVDENNIWVAECHTMEPFSDAQRKNAILISASPDMLMALEKALKDIPLVIRNEGLSYIVEAIAKAKGE